MPMGGAPISGAGMNPGAIDALTTGGGVPAAGGLQQQSSEMLAQMEQFRELDTRVSEIYAAMPALAPLGNQIRALIKQSVVAAAKLMPAQTASSQAVPTGGM